MRFYVLECLTPAGWGLFIEGEPAPVATFAAEHERTAQLCAVLLNAREATPHNVTTPTDAGRPVRLREPARDARMDDEGPDEAAGPHGSTVRVYGESGWAYVRFERKPAAHVLEELRGAGARWLGVRRGWRIQARDLPAAYSEAVAS